MMQSTSDKGKLAWVFNITETSMEGVGHTDYIDKGAVIWCLGGNQCKNEELSGAPLFVFAT
jgi:hypothetical protein